jgi:peptide/nickel transport system substrate-binding protein
LDRQSLNEGIFGGIGSPTETLVPETEPYYPDLDRARMKYPPDQRRAEQLMSEAGFSRDAGGLFADATGRRFRLDFTVSSGPELERGQVILTDSWRRAGFDTYPAVLSQAEARDPSSRHAFVGLASRGGGIGERHFIAAEIGSAANRWSGDNRSGWTDPEYERLWTAFNSTLDINERRRYTVQMMVLVSEHLPVYPLHFAINPRTWVASLQGPDVGGSSGFGLSSPGTTIHWNVHEWELR